MAGEGLAVKPFSAWNPKAATQGAVQELSSLRRGKEEGTCVLSHGVSEGMGSVFHKGVSCTCVSVSVYLYFCMSVC